MRIDNAMPAFYTYFPQNNAALVRYSQPMQTNTPSQPSGGGLVVDISPEGWEAYARIRAIAEGGGAGSIADTDPGCQTCDSRRYQDGSNDPSVSFQTPTHISPGQSASMVMAHENEHIANDRAKAEQEGRRVVSQSVSLQSSICPECKRVYVSGGTTRTVTAEDNSGEAVDTLDIAQFA